MDQSLTTTDWFGIRGTVDMQWTYQTWYLCGVGEGVSGGVVCRCVCVCVCVCVVFCGGGYPLPVCQFVMSISPARLSFVPKAIELVQIRANRKRTYRWPRTN